MLYGSEVNYFHIMLMLLELNVKLGFSQDSSCTKVANDVGWFSFPSFSYQGREFKWISTGSLLAF